MVQAVLLLLKSRFIRLARSQTARLLLLEFAVVLAGVLAAQVLQDWFQGRAERARAAEQRAGVVAALHNSVELGDIRVRTYVCMRDRVERVRDVLSGQNGSDSFADELTVPEQMILDDAGWESARPLLTRYFGTKETMVFSSIQFLIDQMDAAQDTELAAWQRLTLVRRENGPLTPGLRGELQVALADAQRANRVLYEAGQVVYTRGRELKVPTHDATLAAFSRSGKLCAAMVAHPPERHAAAAAKGRLADGTPLHPRLRAMMQPQP
jgi:hypothetical protein